MTRWPNLQRCCLLLIGLGTPCFVAGASLPAETLPAGTNIEVRLKQPLSSVFSKPGELFEGTVIAPVIEGEEVLVPIGSVVIGHIVSIERVGLGFSRETADIALQMDSLQLQDGTTVSLAADVLEVENSRETVVMNHIQGIRSTGTLSHRASGVVGSLAFGIRSL